jgi:IS5 family transposase
MVERDTQLTFGMQEDALRHQKRSMLDDVNEIIDWRPIEKRLVALYSSIGAPAIPPLIMFKILILESWYNLSDVQVVEDIHDKRSFERFVGPDVRHYQIDSSSVVNFRKRLRAANAEQDLLALLNTQLQSRGYIVRTGTIVDATLVKAATTPRSRKQDGTPVDPDVDYTARNGRAIDGMKVHVSVDSESELIEKIDITNIRTSDHEVFATLLPDGTEAAYADKAYDSKEHDTYLATHGISNRIFFRASRAHALTDYHKRKNRVWGRTRAKVERRIAALKNRCSMKRLRYIGLRRNLTQVVFAAITCNLRRIAYIY